MPPINDQIEFANFLIDSEIWSFKNVISLVSNFLPAAQGKAWDLVAHASIWPDKRRPPPTYVYVSIVVFHPNVNIN